jgi:hypothetical protein
LIRPFVEARLHLVVAGALLVLAEMLVCLSHAVPLTVLGKTLHVDFFAFLFEPLFQPVVLILVEAACHCFRIDRLGLAASLTLCEARAVGQLVADAALEVFDLILFLISRADQEYFLTEFGVLLHSAHRDVQLFVEHLLDLDLHGLFRLQVDQCLSLLINQSLNAPGQVTDRLESQVKLFVDLLNGGTLVDF